MSDHDTVEQVFTMAWRAHAEHDGYAGQASEFPPGAAPDDPGARLLAIINIIYDTLVASVSRWL